MKPTKRESAHDPDEVASLYVTVAGGFFAVVGIIAVLCQIF